MNSQVMSLVVNGLAVVLHMVNFAMGYKTPPWYKFVALVNAGFVGYAIGILL